MTTLDDAFKAIDEEAVDKERDTRQVAAINRGEYDNIVLPLISLRCGLLAAGIGVALGAGLWAPALGLFGVAVAQGCFG